MLYSSDGAGIAHMPVKQRFWPDDLQAKYNDIKRSEKEPKEPLREWGSRAGAKRREAPLPGEMGDMDMMMMMEGMF